MLSGTRTRRPVNEIRAKALNSELRSFPKELAMIPDCPFPVGVEYYRPPVPPTSLWDEDFRRIRAAGMRIIRTFPYWNWVEPSDGGFEFDDLDLFFELAEKHDLKVWLDTPVGTHGACPDWLIDLYPDMRVERRDGSITYPTAVPAAPQGTMIHNFDHPAWRRYTERYIRALVTRYKDHPAMWIWGTWDGINLAAAWANGDTYPPYNGYTVARYIAWLKERFTLDELNDRLLRRYRSWEAVQPARSTKAPVDMLLYRQFHFENMADHLGWMADLIDRLDGKHEQRSHGGFLPMPWAEMSSERVDSWGLSASSAGVLTGDDPYSIAEICMGFDWSRAIGRDGRWWHEEIHAGFKKGLCAECKQAIPQESTMFLWLALIEGSAGAMYWQYRPEYMSFEGPGLNLVALDGTPLPRWEAVAAAIGRIEPMKDHLPLAVPRANVALGYSGPSQDIFLYNDQREVFDAALKDTYRALWTHSIPRDVVTPRMDWSPYDVVLLPNFALLDETAIARIRQSLQSPDGPAIVAAGHFGTFSARGHWSFCPPEGLADILDVRIADFDKVTDKDIREGRNILKSEFGERVIKNACDYVILTPGENTRPIATIGEDVVGVQTLDKKFTWFGLPLAAAVENDSPVGLLPTLLDSFGVRSPVTTEGGPLVAFRRDSKRGGSLVFLVNVEPCPTKATIKPDWPVRSVLDLRQNETVAYENGSFSVGLDAGEVGVFYCR